MAKKKVMVDVVIDDKGTTKKVAIDAKKLGKNLDETAISARTADRNLKGAAQASSNATKNFSKMAQGTGGLVAAYATLAANIFAISAAYNFLKKAGDLRVLREGQALYASQTGDSLKVVTMQLQSATQGLLKYADAAQGAAIGTAAGLSADQLSGLATAASNVSKALGRDLTDSYNRLIRGATKAEPELLDELGIILRLDVATAKYAASLGVAAKDLTAFERTQAVTNEILDQATTKFGDFSAIEVSGIERLGKAFDDVVNKIMDVIEPLSSFIGHTLADNVEVLGVAFTGLGAGIVRSITPVMPALQGVDTSQQAIAQRMNAFNPGGETGKKIRLAAEGRGNLTQQDIKRFENAIDKKKSKVLDFERTNQREAKKTAQIAKLSLLEIEKANQTGLTKMGTGWKIYWGTLIAEHGKTMGIMKGITMGFTSAVGKLLGAAGWIGLIISAGVMLRSLYQKIFGDQEKLAQQRAIKDVNEDVKKLDEEVAKVRNSLFLTGNAMDDFAKRVNNALQGNFRPMITSLGTVKEITFDVTKAFDNMAGAVERTAKKKPIPGFNRPTFGGRTTSTQLQKDRVERDFDSSDFIHAFELAKGKVAGYTKALEAMLEQEKRTQGMMIKGTDAYKSQTTRIEKLQKAIEITTDNYQRNEKGVEKLKQAIPGLNDLLRLFVEELSEGEKALTKFDRAMLQVEFGMKKYSEELNKLGEFKTPFTPIIDAVEEISKGLEKIGDSAGTLDFMDQFEDSKLKQFTESVFGAEFVKGIEGYDDLKKKIDPILKSYKEMSRQSLTEKLHTKHRFEILKRGLTPLQKTYVGNQEKVANKAIEIRDIERKILFTLKSGKTISDEQKEAYDAQLNSLHAQLDTLKQMNDEGYQLQQAFQTGFEGNFQKNFAAYLKGDESSIKDAVLGIAKGTLSAVIDKFSEQVTKSFSDTLFGKSEAEKNAELIRQAHTQGIVDGFNKAKESDQVVTAAETEGLMTPISGTTTIDAAIKKTKRTGASGDETGEEQGFWSKLWGSGRSQTSTRDDTHGAEGVNLVGKNASGLKGLFTDFTGDFAAVFDKNAEGGFLGKMGDLFLNFGNNLGGIFDTILGGIGGLFGGGGFNPLSIFGFANGGIVKGGFRKYANGGIARSPHIGMIGEGRYNEAVVPLPDGRSIPVTGGTPSGDNNVTVNVAIDNKGRATSETTADSGMGADLGNLIAKAVQEELQYQKRAGGILNPYGAA